VISKNHICQKSIIDLLSFSMNEPIKDIKWNRSYWFKTKTIKNIIFY